jgi:hypothetical protein
MMATTRRRPVAVLAVVHLVTGAACASIVPSQPVLLLAPPPMPGVVSTHTTAELKGARLTSGWVDGDYCVWLADPLSGDAFTTVWPHDFRADRDPVRVYDGSGRLVATEGEILDLGGATASVPRTRCMVSSEVWFVHAVAPHRPDRAEGRR